VEEATHTAIVKAEISSSVIVSPWSRERLGTLIGLLVAGLLVATASVGIVFVLGAIACIAAALARRRSVSRAAPVGAAAGRSEIGRRLRLLAHESQPRLLGAGTLLGGFASVAFTGRRLALPFGFGLVLWGADRAARGGVEQGLALLLLAAVGIGNAIETSRARRCCSAS
jgi:hypothetical protein